MSDLLSRFKLRKYQVNAEGGMIYVDGKVQKWLDSFKNGDENQKTDIEKEIFKRITKSGHEENKNIKQPDEFPAISVVLVTYNSEIWLENLKKMFSNLSPWLYEIIVVDNGSKDCSVEGIRKLGNSIKIIENEQTVTFAAAVNQGCKFAAGELLLLINPDVFIPKSSLWSLIDFYQKNRDAAAIVPKLMLMKTPGFINGIGNIVPPLRWGYDIGLGHLDVGQFDHVREVPSACFATVLIPRRKWEDVGELDEGYPMYYEDSDWSYRARGMGFKIYINTSSKVFHSFNSNNQFNAGINTNKLFYITYSRLRFITKFKFGIIWIMYLLSYLFFDLSYVVYSSIKYKNHIPSFKTIFHGWIKYVKDFRRIEKLQFQSKDINLQNFLKINPRIEEGLPIVNWNMY